MSSIPDDSKATLIPLGLEGEVSSACVKTTLRPQDVFVWDVLNWARALPIWSSHLKHGPLECLEVGANLGGLSLWLASLGHRVLCTDKFFPARAVEYHRQFHYCGEIRYAAADLLAFAYRDQFDVVACKSVLGGIGVHGGLPAQHAAAEAMRLSLRPRGVLLLAENLAASPLHSLARSTATRWRWRWRYPTLQELMSMLGAFSSIEYRTVGCTAAFGFTETQRRVLGWVDRKFDFLVPPAWRYVWGGVARR